MVRYSLSEICEKIDEYDLKGSTENLFIEKITMPEAADELSMVFISPHRQDKQEKFNRTKARLVICDDSIQFDKSQNKCLIIVKDPKYVFAKISNALFIKKPDYKIHPTAVIHEEAVIAKNVYIGAHSYIGKCKIKENTVIHGHCYLYDNVSVGNDVIINAGAIIGANGCGQIRGRDEMYIPFPHIGGVIIESHVEIGTNACIAKGALSNTIIKKGSVIDSFVQVGHNVVIEENVLILANSVIGGSSIIKRNAVIAIGAHVCDYVSVGENAHVGPGVVIMSDIPDYAKVVPRPPLLLPQKEWKEA